MGKRTRYFVRTSEGEKGPYSFAQLKAAVAARAVKKGAECRAEDNDQWRSIESLLDDVKQKKSKKAQANQDNSKGPELDIPPPDHSFRDAAILIVVIVVFGSGAWAFRNHQRSSMGEPCRTPKDCPSSAACMLVIDEDRNVKPEGYCTFKCSDTDDCQNGMHCGKGAEIGPQGQKWDGMFGKSEKVCIKLNE